ncbi:type IV secretion protein Rhs [Enterobacteriaceae bacterium LUAb1]
MTTDKIKMCQALFGESIIYHNVWIHKGSYLPFGLQDKQVAMTPSGEIYFRNDYSSDFSKEFINRKHLFIHEMSHVWQYQHGMNVKTRGLISWAVDYHYELHGWGLAGYGMEQQAQIIADYFLLTQFDGRKNWKIYNKCKNCHDLSDTALIRMYKDTLRAFPRWQQ